MASRSSSTTTSTILIENAHQIVTMASNGRTKTGGALSNPGVIADASLAIRNGQIISVGQNAARTLDRDGDVLVIDANRGVVLPGFVDPHTHIIFAGGRSKEFEARQVGGRSFMDFVKEGGGSLDTVRATRRATDDQLRGAIAMRMDRMLRSGTTTAEVKSGYGLTVDEELRQLRLLKDVSSRSPSRVVATGLAAHFRPPDGANVDAYVDDICHRFIPTVAVEKLATSIDVFCDPGAYSEEQCERILTVARDEGLRTRVHADQLSQYNGAELAARHSALSADHLGHISQAGISMLAQSGTVAVLIPGSLFFVPGEKTPPVREMIEAGVAIAVSSDYNPGSSPMSSQALAISLACVLFHLPVAAALAGATINAAAAVGMERQIGSLEQGKAADVLILDADDYRDIAYRFGENLVRKVFIGGEQVVERPQVGPI